MQSYFFHLKYLGSHALDYEGTKLEDLQAAQGKARSIIRELAADHVKAERDFNLRSVLICTLGGGLLAEVLACEWISEALWPRFFTPFPDSRMNQH